MTEIEVPEPPKSNESPKKDSQTVVFIDTNKNNKALKDAIDRANKRGW